MPLSWEPGSNLSTRFGALVLLSSSLFSRFLNRCHRDHVVIPLFTTVEFSDFQKKPILLNPEIRVFTNGQEHWMLLVARTNPIKNTLTTQDVFLTEHLLGLLVRTIGSYYFTDECLAGVFGIAARYRFHAHQAALLIEVVLRNRR